MLKKMTLVFNSQNHQHKISSSHYYRTKSNSNEDPKSKYHGMQSVVKDPILNITQLAVPPIRRILTKTKATRENSSTVSS